MSKLNFKKLKDQVQVNFDKMVTSGSGLFHTNPDRDKIWNEYLNGFDNEEDRQYHNCNCCKSFLRQYGGVVTIVNNEVVSLWDGITNTDFTAPVENLRKYIHSLPVSDIFINETTRCGVDKSNTIEGLIWNHFYFNLPKEFVKPVAQIDTLKGKARETHSMMSRALGTITDDAVDVVLELIAQKSLYRGNEFENNIKEFKKLKVKFKTAKNKNLFCWTTNVSDAVSRIRNSAIGTLLIDLSEGVDLDTAVTKYERVVAPSNYKRPTALVTPKMVEDAKKTLQDLGLLDSLERRFATETDISVENVLFTSKKKTVLDVFEEVAKDALVDPRKFSQVETVSIEDFLSKVVPTAKELEVLVENSHLKNLVSLVTAVDPKTPSLFKWDNPFSWSYTGGITDSMKERVKAAGGKVDGVLRFSIQWNEDGKSSRCDLDAWAFEPNGHKIYFGSNKQRPTSMTGVLDVDIINPGSSIAVENITWSDINKMKEGDYKFVIHNYNSGGNTGFSAQIEFDGQIFDFGSSKRLTNTMEVAIVNYSKRNGFTMKSSMGEGTSTLNTKEEWGIKTHQFHKVNKIMLSPNHWGKPVGNKHYLFLLDKCVATENPKPFFNEFLKQDLDKHRKVFEILNSKINVENSNDQLSGLGFSETLPMSLLVKVKGSFERVVRVVIK